MKNHVIISFSDALLLDFIGITGVPSSLSRLRISAVGGNNYLSLLANVSFMTSTLGIKAYPFSLINIGLYLSRTNIDEMLITNSKL